VPVNSAAVVVGRLLEVRLDAGYRSIHDVEAVRRAIHREVSKLPINVRIVTVADWRRCPVMSEDATQRLVEQLRANNPRIERSAALSSKQSAIAELQFQRLCRESDHPERRLFHEPQAVISWLSEVLTEPELVRLRAFLAEPEAGSAKT
jgi:hypothetical protein